MMWEQNVNTSLKQVGAGPTIAFAKMRDPADEGNDLLLADAVLRPVGGIFLVRKMGTCDFVLRRNSLNTFTEFRLLQRDALRTSHGP
jgi:hypothetical protein